MIQGSENLKPIKAKGHEMEEKKNIEELIKSLGSVIRDLKSEDEVIRRSAGEKLDLIEDELEWKPLTDTSATAIEPLVNALKDNEERIRIRAASTLGKIGVPAAIEPLLGLLKDGTGLDRQFAADALGDIFMQAGVKRYSIDSELAEKAARSLCEHLNDHDTPVQGYAANALDCASLYGIADTSVIETLISVLNGHEDYAVRVHVAYALGNIKDPRAEKALTAVATKALTAVATDWNVADAVQRAAKKALLKHISRR